MTTLSLVLFYNNRLNNGISIFQKYITFVSEYIILYKFLILIMKIYIVYMKLNLYMIQRDSQHGSNEIKLISEHSNEHK